ncbi:(d)CMP kinase [bacterium]|nr:(d)CMP kinase [bacterium]
MNNKDLVIVVGGPGGSGSSTIAKMMEKHFQLKRVYGGEIMRELVAKEGYKSFEDFYVGQNEDALLAFDKKIDDILIEKAKEGNVLIESKVFAGIATVQKIPTTVKIWLTASLDVRSKRSVMKTDTKNVFKKFFIYLSFLRDLQKRYTLDKNRYKKLYGIDYDRPELYNDIIIDSSNLNEQETLDLILEKIKDGGYIK